MGTEDLVAAYTELRDVRPGYCMADDFYRGEVDEIFASRRVQRLLARAGASSIEEFNYARIPVDVVANRLKIQAITAIKIDQGEDEEDVEDEEAQRELDHLWEMNQLGAEAPHAHLETCKMGDAYIVVWPRYDDSGKVVDVDIRVNCATQVRMIYDAEDPLLKRCAIKSWEEVGSDGKTRVRANMYYQDRIERWVKIVDTDGKKPEDWVKFGDDLENPWEEIPVFHMRNDRPYGKPEHRGAYGPQQLINKIIVAHAATIDFQSFPQRYALTNPKGDPDLLGNKIDPFNPEDEDDDPEGAGTGGASGLSADPSALWKLPGVSSVGQFSPADPMVFMNPFDRYVRAMAQLTDTPPHNFGTPNGQTPSGEALRTEEAPTVSKIENRQMVFEAVWVDVFTFALRLLGFENVRVRLTWKPAQTITDAEGWTTVKTKQDAGVPQEQTLIEAGYLPDQVKEWLDPARHPELSLAKRIELLATLGTAVQALGAGVTLGVVSQPQVDQLVHMVIGQMTDEDIPAGPPLPPPAAPPQPGSPQTGPPQAGPQAAPPKGA